MTGQDAKSSKTGESTLFLSSKTVVPGGYDFDWRHGTVNEGYLDQVVPKGMSYVDFMKSQAALSTGSPDWQKVEFTLTNGTPLTAYTNRDTFVKPLLDLRSNLITSVADLLRPQEGVPGHVLQRSAQSGDRAA